MKDYKKILEGVVNIINTAEKSDIGFANICTYIGENCPELKESEDESMVKFIKNQLFNIKKTITENYELDAKLTNAICWLEKQCEQKIKTPEESLGINSDTYNKIVDECIYGEQKPAVVIPKFRVGDTIKCKYDDRQFTIKSVDLDKGTYTYTQESCGNDIDYADEDFELVEQKPAWSEKDNEHVNSLLKRLDGLCRKEFTTTRFAINEDEDWLKSLKDKYTWKPSEEQMEAFEHFVWSFGESGYASPYDNNTKLLYSLLWQLKKLK